MKVDVLSYFDDLIRNGEEHHEQEAREARAAVAELVDLRESIADLFRIGSDVRTNSVILANVSTVKRFADYLHAIESEFFMVPGSGEVDEEYPDDEPEPECLLNCWGSTKEQYIEQFRAALAKVKP